MILKRSLVMSMKNILKERSWEFQVGRKKCHQSET